MRLENKGIGRTRAARIRTEFLVFYPGQRRNGFMEMKGVARVLMGLAHIFIRGVHAGRNRCTITAAPG